jgi:hypothetical protein
MNYPGINVSEDTDILVQDNVAMNKEEFLSKVDTSMQQHKEGKYKELTAEYRDRLFGEL